MEQPSISSPNSSKGYHPTISQGPKSVVFSSFISAPVKQNDLIKLTVLRDEFYQDHITKKPEEVQKFVLSFTSKANKPEHGKAIACALLTLRDQKIFSLLFDFIFVQQKSQEFIPIVDTVWNTINDSVRKSFLFFSPNASRNTLSMLTFACDKNINFSKTGDLANFLTSSIDVGSITQNNLILVDYFIYHTQKFPQFWTKLEYITVFLIIKFLRFYQDTFLIKEEIPDRTKGISAQSSSTQIRSISASTSAIPTLNDSSSRSSMALIQKALSLASNYENFFPTFFNVAVNTNAISKYAFKEIERILYDPRTCQKMSTKFPLIYKSFTSIHENYIASFTNNSILQVMLPYYHLKEMLIYNNLPQKSDLDFPNFMKRNSKLVDFDLILSDAIRTYLQGIDYERTPTEHRISFIHNVLNRAIDKGVKLNSSLHSLVCDFFVVPADLNENPESQRKISLLVTPTIAIFEKPEMEKLSSTIVEMILVRLKQPDFMTTKTNSFRNLTRFLTEQKGINIIDCVMSFSHLNDTQKEEFRNFATYHDNNVIPTQIVEFSRTNQPLDSNNGLAAVQTANEKFLSLYAQNGNNWELSIPSIKKIFDALVPSSRKGIEVILDMIDIHAITPCMSSNLFDAQTVLKFVNERKLYSEFDEALQYTDTKFYCDALVGEISSNVHYSHYRPFLIICKSFRKNLEVLKNICDFSQMSLIAELADLPYLDVGHEAQLTFMTRIFSICSKWQNDSLSKLTVLLGGIIQTPQDLAEFSDAIVKSFDQLPQILLFFFQNMIVMRIDPFYNQLVNKLQQLKTPKAVEFCKEIIIKWNAKKTLNPQVSRPLLVPDIIL